LVLSTEEMTLMALRVEGLVVEGLLLSLGERLLPTASPDSHDAAELWDRTQGVRWWASSWVRGAAGVGASVRAASRRSDRPEMWGQTLVRDEEPVWSRLRGRGGRGLECAEVIREARGGRGMGRRRMGWKGKGRE
jgi:hypothetical protein